MKVEQRIRRLETLMCCDSDTAVGCEQLSEDQARTYYVDLNGDNTLALPGSQHCPYRTINAAITAAKLSTDLNTAIIITPGIHLLTEQIDYSGLNTATFIVMPGAIVQSGGNWSCFKAASSATNVTITGGGLIVAVNSSKYCIEGTNSNSLTVKNISLLNAAGSCIGGTWTTLKLSNVLMDAVSPCITSTLGAGSNVVSVNNVSNVIALATIVWQVQPLTVDSNFTID